MGRSHIRRGLIHGTAVDKEKIGHSPLSYILLAYRIWRIEFILFISKIDNTPKAHLKDGIFFSHFPVFLYVSSSSSEFLLYSFPIH